MSEQLVARLRAAASNTTHWPAIDLLMTAADALEAVEANLKEQAAEANYKVITEALNEMRARAWAAEARAEKAERELVLIYTGEDVAKVTRDIYNDRQAKITELDIPAGSTDPDFSKHK